MGIEVGLGEKKLAKKTTAKRTALRSPALIQRTRSHIIASLSANSIERVFLERGHTVLKTEQDYGVDLVVFTYSKSGFVEAGNIYIQLKATDAPVISADRTFYSFSISTRDYNAWTIEPMPVILILYDAAANNAYWQYVQGYFAANPATRPKASADSVTVRIPAKNLFDMKTVDYCCTKKQAVLKQIHGVIKHVL
jgi:Domain of unknown function (DUF4365)